MKASRPLPTWLQWVMRILGVGIPIASLALLIPIVASINTIKTGFSGPHALSDKAMTTLVARLCAEVVSVIVAFLVGAWLLRRARTPKPGTEEKSAETVPSVAMPKAMRHARAGHWSTCNVLHVGAGARQVWQFDARNGGVVLGRAQSSAPGEPLPDKLVAKSWGSLWQKKLNVAWLPPENVFIRVAQFPEASPEEMLSMVELQLEKLSPIPVTQAVWSLHLFPVTSGQRRPALDGKAATNLQTVAVVVVARDVVEEFLGKLEGEGYLADRLELPLLDQLQASTVTEDGAWIYPETQGGRNAALVAWWYGGVLSNVDLLTLPAAGAGASLKDQLMQMAWAGELDGWLTTSPRWHLVGDDAAAARWIAPLQEGLEQAVEVIAPLPDRELAARTAQRAVHADPRVNLLPVEFGVRYRQQFVGRLWMHGVFALLTIYGVGLLIYFVALGVMSYRTGEAETLVRATSLDYTNALQIKAQYQVLKERQELKYAALDCWEAVAEHLPESITLDSMNFGEAKGLTGGKTLSLIGTAPASEVNTLFDFSDKLRRATARGQPLFDLKKFEPPHTAINSGGATIRWTFDLELKRSETK